MHSGSTGNREVGHRRNGSWGAFLVGAMLLSMSVGAAATTLYVNNRTGSDAFDGRAPGPAADGKSGPFATIMKAVSNAPVSAHIEIANTGLDYREHVRVEGKGKGGTPSAPMVIDGHGATVSGLLAVPAGRWTLYKDDVYGFKNRTPDGKPASMPHSNWLGFLKHQGWFTEPEAPEIFFLNGKPGPNVVTFEELPPGGFFYDTLGTLGEARQVYFRLPPGAALENLTIEMPLNDGVFVDADYVVVRNLRSVYSSADGFSGYWGYGDVYENIEGSFNCDQGFTMHGNCVTIVDGGLFERNGGMGILDVMSSVSIFRNIVVRKNLIGGASFQGSFHSCRDSQFTDNAGGQVGGNNVDLENCLVRGGRQGIAVDRGSIKRCTVVNAGQGISVGRGATIEGCLLVSNGVAVAVAKEAVGNVKLEKNILSPGKAVVEWGGDKIGPDRWDAFAQTNSASLIGNIIDAPLLEAPLYQLPTESPLRKGGEFGATVKEFTGWKPVE